MNLIINGGGIISIPPYAWESKEGVLLYTPNQVKNYNKEYHNDLGKEDELYTRGQIISISRIAGLSVEDTSRQGVED